MSWQPLSQSLAEILAGESAAAGVTLNQLLARTEGRGLHLVIIVLCLPFIAPVSVPGVSTVLGPVIALLALQLTLGRPPSLPGRVGNRVLPPSVQKILLGGGVKFLRIVEKAAKPRATRWLGWRVARIGNALLIVFMAVLLALPLPPVPPLTNTLPSYAIILLAVSMMEADGALIWAAYATTLLTVGYFGFWAEVLGTHLAGWIHQLLELVRATL